MKKTQKQQLAEAVAIAAAEASAEDWNQRCPIGTRVSFTFKDLPAEIHTSTAAALVVEDAGKHHAMLPIKGGKLLLAHCTPATEAAEEPAKTARSAPIKRGPRGPYRLASYERKLAITPAEYMTLQHAYDELNKQLFRGQLPAVMITLQRQANSKGYFHQDKFAGRGVLDMAAHELALNPDTFASRTDEEILSTLAHEMCHVWQATYGTPTKAGYHSQEWAGKMKAIGLQPTDTGEPGGKETGQRVTHFIIEGGAYQLAYKALEAKGLRLAWQSRPDEKTRQKKAASKTKYTCQQCGQNAWAKPGADLICGICFASEDNELMQPEEAN